MTAMRFVSRRRAEAVAAALCLVLAGCSTPPPARNTAQQASATHSQGAARALAAGELEQSLTLYTRALAAAESVEDFELSGAALLNLALVHARRGEVALAHGRLARIMAAPQRFGAPLQARAGARKALLHLDANELDAALQAADAAQAACVTPCDVAAVLANVRAHTALLRGDGATAATEAQRAVTLATEQPAELANAQRQLGRARLQQGQAGEAAAALALALAIDQRLGLPERIGLDLLLAGDAEVRRSQTGAAREFYERALAVYRAGGFGKSADAARARLDALGK